MVDRRAIDVATPSGGWEPPWPNVAEIEAVLPHQKWTLVGGLMTQLHGIHRGIDTLRPTSDVDMVLHLETSRGVAAETARALESLGSEFAPSIDDRNDIAHRFRRGDSTVDLATGGGDVVDVLIATTRHRRWSRSCVGKSIVTIEGGTQALKRTINARLRIVSGRTTTVSVPSPLGAVIFKAAASQTDLRDSERHLQDAAPLLAVLEDQYAERAGLTGSDGPRLQPSSAPFPTVLASGGCWRRGGGPTVRPRSRLLRQSGWTDLSSATPGTGAVLDRGQPHPPVHTGSLST